MNFGENLKKLRQQHNMRQKDIADRIGISSATIAYYECGLREPNITIACLIADVFDTSVDEMCGRKDYAKDFFGWIVENTEKVKKIIEDLEKLQKARDKIALTDEDLANYVYQIMAEKAFKEFKGGFKNERI